MFYYVPWAYPKLVTEYYSRMVDNFVDNIISATNLVNTLVIVNMERFKDWLTVLKSTGGLEL
jgi:hypothetical protein